MEKLSLVQRLKLLIFGYCYLRSERKEGWKGYLPIYLVKCSTHGYFEAYPSGYREEFLCPKCLTEDVGTLKLHLK